MYRLQVKDLAKFLDPSGLGVISFEDFHRGISAISNGGQSRVQHLASPLCPHGAKHRQHSSPPSPRCREGSEGRRLTHFLSNWPQTRRLIGGSIPTPSGLHSSGFPHINKSCAGEHERQAGRAARFQRGVATGCGSAQSPIHLNNSRPLCAAASSHGLHRRHAEPLDPQNSIPLEDGVDGRLRARGPWPGLAPCCGCGMSGAADLVTRAQEAGPEPPLYGVSYSPGDGAVGCPEDYDEVSARRPRLPSVRRGQSRRYRSGNAPQAGHPGLAAAQQHLAGGAFEDSRYSLTNIEVAGMCQFYMLVDSCFYSCGPHIWDSCLLFCTERVYLTVFVAALHRMLMCLLCAL
ncbi:Rab11 family-interacting protein 3 [Liparis tanakae]|uniref:Rab11 family-interacting protein 3 n=1 Tax=Liparis tanakae TaxID=230148 RepID=A0A4Z2F5V8_9TELE|nr:Rab11 family-interacting protein 3 [Liparis tanakae]